MLVNINTNSTKTSSYNLLNVPLIRTPTPTKRIWFELKLNLANWSQFTNKSILSDFVIHRLISQRFTKTVVLKKAEEKKRKGTELQSKSPRQSDQTYCLLSCWEKRRSKEMEKHDGGKEAKKMQSGPQSCCWQHSHNIHVDTWPSLTWIS